MARNPIKAAHAKGASSSLKKSIEELEAFLAGAAPIAPGPLRDELHDKIADLALKWYRKGFSRGHRESHAIFRSKGKVPKLIPAEVKRRLFGVKRRNVNLKSTIK